VLGSPIASYRQTLNKRTGKLGPKRCMLKNECLVCDGTCVGHDRTARRMAQRRAEYAERQEELRERMSKRRLRALMRRKPIWDR